LALEDDQLDANTAPCSSQPVVESHFRLNVRTVGGALITKPRNDETTKGTIASETMAAPRLAFVLSSFRAFVIGMPPANAVRKPSAGSACLPCGTSARSLSDSRGRGAARWPPAVRRNTAPAALRARP